MTTTLLPNSLIDSLILKDAKHLEQKLREAIHARVGDVPLEQLRGRLDCISCQMSDSYYLDKKLLFTHVHSWNADWDESTLTFHKNKSKMLDMDV